ncbi:MAG: amidohydrolase [Desulfobacterales bacterium]|nr:MAG: amidohydrolase [Desulfobacterales bacterium]
MDIIFYNGRINTLDDSAKVCTAVGAANGTITAVGSDEELYRLRRSATELVDLKGAVMFPGFMEAHNHLMIYGYLIDGIDLSASNAAKMADILTLVKSEAEKHPPGTWIKGSRYAEYFLAENRHPTRADLDQVSPQHPVILYHTSFHACALNSLALKTIGIDRETAAPQGGIIEKDPADGEPTGVLHDNAMTNVFNTLFFDDLAAMSRQRRISLCSTATESFASRGLVLVADAMVAPQTLEIYQETLAAGRLKIRIYTMNHDIMADSLVDSRIKTGFGCPQLRIGPIKIFADGGMSNRTAAVGDPYLTPPYGKGLKIQSREELIEIVKRYHALGYQIAIHAQGDAGIADTLDAYEAVLGPRSSNPQRHRIEHGGCLYPDLLHRAAAMNIPVAVQPVFFSELGDGFLEAFGVDLAQKLYPFKSMLEAGIKIGGSSDCPVCMLDPRLGLRDAVLRRSPSGEIIGAHEALTMDQAIALYTRGAAYLSFDENHNGSIAPGKRADFTVMAADPRDVKPEEVPDIPFTMTVVGGEIVWSK